MKRLLYILTLTLLLWSCDREDQSEIKPGFLELISSDPELSVLNQAIEKANLKGALAGTQYTLHAPVNEAFQGVDLNALSQQQLLNILRYHISPTRYDSARFSVENALLDSVRGSVAAPKLLSTNGGNLASLTTLNTSLNANIFYTNSSRLKPGSVIEKDGIFVNGIRILKANAYQGSDGVVHKISGLLMPPAGFAAEYVKSSSNLSLFYKLVSKASSGTPGAVPFYESVLNASKTVTVFAPTDAAMLEAGYDETFINNATPASLLTIAQGHVVSPGTNGLRRFMSDLMKSYKDGASAQATLQSGKTVIYADGDMISGTLNTSVTVSKPNVVVTNGVVHVVDRILN